MDTVYQEITCPYCRIGFGAIKIFDKREKKSFLQKVGLSNPSITRTVEHLDILWTNESGLIKTCTQSDYVLSQLLSVDDSGNPTFKDDFQNKLNELREKFETNPDDISKETVSIGDFMISFVECMNYGSVEGEDEEYDREIIKQENFKELYESGINLKDALKKFIIKSSDNTQTPQQ
jgi:hypothetical protein